METSEHIRLGPAAPAIDAEAMAAEAQILASRGVISALYGLLLHSPPVARGWETFLRAVRRESGLDPLLREIVILRVAVLNDAPYEFDTHLPIAQANGLNEAQARDIRQADGAMEAFDALQRLVIVYADAMTRSVHVAEDLRRAVHQAFDPRALVELTATIAAYNMVSRFLVALDVH